ncbi:hypothetical protein RQM47_16915 [Rubrivirga sp. S365]|uniref:hypothetical protein n=1 Tax=Rubrivirga sp. S365 TaxID=3076080 RepID=UPI0028C6832F|nr:hypothetical protein [Rubrivirga sp. S365]MDT7858333.1 hypothetical protein [Rubrivirga sp. S365]
MKPDAPASTPSTDRPAPRSRVFYAVYIEDRRLGTCLDATRLLMDPATRTRAHVTVRGPYDKRLRRLDEAFWNAQLKHEVLRLVEPGSFFGQGQNTVYLRCEAPALRDVWKKPDYPEFTPHLTLYDGPSRSHAERLLDLLTRRPAKYCVRSIQLEPLRSPRRPYRSQTEIGPEAHVDAGYLSRVVGRDLPLTDLDRWDAEKRFDALGALWGHLADVWEEKSRTRSSVESVCADEDDLAAAGAGAAFTSRP